VSQAVVIYVVYGGDVFLICWFGTQLTHHVRLYGLLLLLFLQRHVENAENFQQIRNLELLSVVDPFLQSLAFYFQKLIKNFSTIYAYNFAFYRHCISLLFLIKTEKRFFAKIKTLISRLLGIVQVSPIKCKYYFEFP